MNPEPGGLAPADARGSSKGIYFLAEDCDNLFHGLAFSQTLREPDLTGARLVPSLLGFNLGIETMQLIMVALVWPPLILLAGVGPFALERRLARAAGDATRVRIRIPVAALPAIRPIFPAREAVVAASFGLLARVGRYQALRQTTAVAVAAAGWLLAPGDVANPVAAAADRLRAVAVPVVVALWTTAAVLTLTSRRPPARTGGRGPPTQSRSAPAVPRRSLRPRTG